MKRVVAAVVVVTTALLGLIAYRIRAQTEAEAGPARGSGIIEAEAADLSARLSARVVRVPVAEGQRVEQGAVILELDCSEPRARLDEAEARLRAAESQAVAAAAQADAAHGQTAAARASINAAGAQLGSLETQRELADREAARLSQMGQFAAASARDRAEANAASLADQRAAALAARLASRRTATAAGRSAAAATAQADAATRNAEAISALVESARLMVAECTIRAPRAGVLERVYYDPGELVLPGSVVARLLDPAVTEITFYVSTADLSQARVGMPVRVVADAYPDRAFKGAIERIGLEAEFTPRNIQTRSDRDRLVFPIEVRIDDPEAALRTGMHATVTLSEDKS